MSANTIVDLGGTAFVYPSLVTTPATSGNAYSASGAIIGQGVDMLNANNMCNLFAVGCPAYASGQLRLQVQCSDSDVSGTYTDPTSGLAVLPTSFQSGGILWLNSGALLGGVLGAPTSGQNIQSGFAVFAGFQRPYRYARVNMLAGDFYAGSLTAGFVSQLKTTGSGGGFTLSPGSGGVNV